MLKMPIKKVEPGVKSPATTINSLSKNQENVNLLSNKFRISKLTVIVKI